MLEASRVVAAEARPGATAVWRRVPADAWAMAAIAAVVVLANAPSLLSFARSNPLDYRSGLASSVTPGRLPGERAIDPNDGYVSQALGHRAALDWIHLRVPWWNPYEGAGAPLAGEMQSGAFFPPTLLTLLPNGQLYEHVLLEILAGLCTYLLLRRLALGRWASAAGGIAFALNGTFAWLAHAPVNPVPFLPALLLGVELAFSATVAGRRGGWWLVAVAGAASFYAGFPETAFIGALLGVGWFAWRCSCVSRESLWAFARKSACGAVVGVLLSAPLLVASLDYVSEGSLGAHAGNLPGATHLPLQAIPQLVLPYVHGPIFAFGDPKLTLTGIWGHVGGFLSTSLLLLALLGATSRSRRGLRLLLLVWIALSLARIYGAPRPLDGVLGLVPGMSHVAFYRYGFPSVELALIVLAAIGLDEIASGAVSRLRLAAVAGLTLAAVAVAAVGARSLPHHHYLALSLVWASTVVLALAVARRAWLATLIVAVDALVLFALPQASAPREVAIDKAPVEFLQRHLGTSRFFTLGPLQPNYGSYYGIGSLNVNDVPVPKAFTAYVHGRLDDVVDPMVFVGNDGGWRPRSAPSPAQELLRNLPAYRAASVAYVLAPAGHPLGHSRSFALAFRSPTTRIYRLSGTTPYVTAEPACAVRATTQESVQLSCARPARLVRRETYMRGWSARVDGGPAPVHRIDGVFQAVDVPAGTHSVTFTYSPPYIWWGVAAFAAGCISLLAAWLLMNLKGGPPGPAERA
jgi:Bacterial membrane protein YfhO